MTVEAEFDSAGGYTLRINVDPRTFLAADPTALPPVPASWYLEQTPEQVTATHEKAQQYLTRSLGLLFDGGKKVTLPVCKIQAIDGADNTPLHADTQEVHLLGTASGRLPSAATTFQVDFAKDANTSLILLHSLAGKTELRPRVVFPGETSLPFRLQTTPSAPVPSEKAPPSKTHEIFLVITVSVVCIVVIVGWLLLSHYRHHHRAHRKAGERRM